MTVEALRAADLLAEQVIQAEVIDLRTLRPWDAESVLKSVRKTGRILVVDTSWKSVRFGAEVVERVALTRLLVIHDRFG